MAAKEKPVRIDAMTRKLIRKRREWRNRALMAAQELATWPAGKPGREKAEERTNRGMNMIRYWFRATRAEIVVYAVQRRAVIAWRESLNSVTEIVE